LAWKLIQGEGRKKIIRMGIVGILITGAVTVTAGSLPVVSVSTGVDQELRVMPPAGFPLTMQQYRNYESNQFDYRIVLGWPDGLPIYESMLIDDQSEFIHVAHLVTATYLGLLLLTNLAIILGLIYIFEWQKRT